MSLRDWRARRIIALCVVWIVGVLSWSIIRAVLVARASEAGSDDLSIIVRVPGGAWTVVGPPLLLLALWSWNRRSSSVRETQ